MAPKIRRLHHEGGGLISLFEDGEKVREFGITPGWDFKDRDDVISRYNSSRKLEDLTRMSSTGLEKLLSNSGLDNPRVTQVRIVAAAMKIGTLVVVGVRHFDKLMVAQMKEAGVIGSGLRPIQGFVDNRYQFLSRQEALIVAKAAKQIIHKHPPEHELFSEDLW